MRPLSRVDPVLPVGAMKTYAAVSPLGTHWRPATCAEVGCAAYESGWRTAVDEATELGARQAAYIRGAAGRYFHEAKTPEGLTLFTFKAGQQCFRAHRTPLERDPIFFVRPGDWRGQTGPVTIHRNHQDWVEDFASHQLSLAERLQKG